MVRLLRELEFVASGGGFNNFGARDVDSVGTA
jgi:hypothetical protein